MLGKKFYEWFEFLSVRRHGKCMFKSVSSIKMMTKISISLSLTLPKAEHSSASTFAMGTTETVVLLLPCSHKQKSRIYLQIEMYFVYQYIQTVTGWHIMTTRVFILEMLSLFTIQKWLCHKCTVLKKNNLCELTYLTSS